MNTFRVFRAFFQANLQQDLAYRADTVVNIVVSIFWLGWDLAGLSIIFANTQDINGWRTGDLVMLLGVFRLINVLAQMVIWPNTELFNRGIREGTLDYTFLMPANSQALVSIRRIVVWQAFNIIVSIALLAGGLVMVGGSVTALSMLSFIVLVISGMALIYSLWIVLISLTFWFTKFDNNVTLLQALLDTGRFPATVYPVWLRILVTFIVPIAVATTVPLQALRGELELWQILAYLAAGVAGFWFATRVWKAGSRKYSGASA